MKADVLGWFDHQNVGDESYKLSFPLLFPGYELNFVNELRPRDVRADVMFMGGGDIVYKKTIQELVRLKASKKVSCHLFSVSLSSCDCLDMLPGLFESVHVRDQRSVEKLQAVGIPCRYMPDAAFALDADPGRGRAFLEAAFKQNGHELYKRVILVTVNAYLGLKDVGLMRDAATFMKAAYDLARIADRTAASFVFVPFSTAGEYDDRVTNGFINSLCKFWRKNIVIYDRLTPQMTLDIFAAADTAITSRLHASIFATIGQTPFIDLTHHDKNRDFLSSVNLLPWSMDWWTLESRQLEAVIESHARNGDTARKTLRAITDDNKKLLAEIPKLYAT